MAALNRTAAKRRLGKKRARTKRPSAGLPDLDSILDAFAEALALIQAAHMAQKQTDHWGPPQVAMSRGIAGLDRVYNDFDRATIDLAQFLQKQHKTTRRKS